MNAHKVWIEFLFHTFLEVTHVSVEWHGGGGEDYASLWQSHIVLRNSGYIPLHLWNTLGLPAM